MEKGNQAHTNLALPHPGPVKFEQDAYAGATRRKNKPPLTILVEQQRIST